MRPRLDLHRRMLPRPRYRLGLYRSSSNRLAVNKVALQRDNRNSEDCDHYLERPMESILVACVL